LRTSSKPTFDGFQSTPIQDVKIYFHAEPSKDGVGFVANKYTISLPSCCPKSAGKLFKGYGGVILLTVRRQGC